MYATLVRRCAMTDLERRVMSSNDEIYYALRAHQERERAAGAADAKVAQIHFTFAELYEQWLADPTSFERQSSQKTR